MTHLVRGEKKFNWGQDRSGGWHEFLPSSRKLSHPKMYQDLVVLGLAT